MSGLTEDRKDQLAARALSRLSEPQLPDGFAARIAARATSAQQTPATSRDTIAANEAELLPAADRTPLDPARPLRWPRYVAASAAALAVATVRSEEQTSELQSLKRIHYAVFCMNKKTYNLP